MSTISIKNRKPRVALVLPNMQWCEWDENTLWHYIPYNLCILAAMILEDYEVSIIDANVEHMSESHYLKALEELQPDAVGITVMMDQYADAGHRAAELTKQFNLEVPVVLGRCLRDHEPRPRAQ